MKLAIGLPIVETIPGECFGAHVATIIEAYDLVGKDNLVTITPVGLCPHDFARKEVMDTALKQGCDRVFFIDDDTITPRGGLKLLWKTMEEKKCTAVTGFYLRRGNPYTPVWSVQKDEQWFNVDADGGVHEIHCAGLGSCLVDLGWVAKQVPRPWFRMKQDEEKTIITDDVVFFEAIRKAGGTILGNADVQCTHIGRREMITRTSAQGLRQVFEALNGKEVKA